jgi:isocitrate dehydrogenase
MHTNTAFRCLRASANTLASTPRTAVFSASRQAPRAAFVASQQQFAQRRNMATTVKKIKVKNPVVELDGDEMTRIIWKDIKDKVSMFVLHLQEPALITFSSLSIRE